MNLARKPEKYRRRPHRTRAYPVVLYRRRDGLAEILRRHRRHRDAIVVKGFIERDPGGRLTLTEEGHAVVAVLSEAD